MDDCGFFLTYLSPAKGWEFIKSPLYFAGRFFHAISSPVFSPSLKVIVFVVCQPPVIEWLLC
jgi:uncharacterized membrane protein